MIIKTKKIVSLIFAARKGIKAIVYKNIRRCMNKNLIFLYFFIFLFTSCSFLTIETKAKNELIDSFTTDINNLHNIKILPIRIQFEFSENVSKLSFYSYQKVDIEEVRQYLLESIEKFGSWEELEAGFLRVVFILG